MWGSKHMWKVGVHDADDQLVASRESSVQTCACLVQPQLQFIKY